MPTIVLVNKTGQFWVSGNRWSDEYPDGHKFEGSEGKASAFEMVEWLRKKYGVESSVMEDYGYDQFIVKN